MPNDEDLLYEEELLRNPYSLKMWTRYIEARKGIAAKRRYILYERAVKALPGSYKVTVAADIQIGKQHVHSEMRAGRCWLGTVRHLFVPHTRFTARLDLRFYSAPMYCAVVACVPRGAPPGC